MSAAVAKSESDLWGKIKDCIDKKCHYSRVESHATSPGIPDLSVCHDGAEGFIELKFSDGKKVPEMRESQVRWITKRVESGGCVVILAEIVDPQYPDLSTRCLYSGSKVVALSEAKTPIAWIMLADVAWTNHIGWKFIFGHAVLMIRDMRKFEAI
jgi:hypothetical protein